MSATRKHSRKRRPSRRGWTQPGDELVAIVGERVVAALEAYSFSASELANEIGDKQQTISLICTGTTKRTRLARVNAIAAVFELPPEWFTGEMELLPGHDNFWTGPFLRPGIQGPHHPAAWQLAISKWVTRVQEAHKRDSRAAPGRRLEQFLRERFALEYIINPAVWRDLLFESGDWRQLPDEEEPIDEDTQVQLVNFMLDAFEPWLAGKTKLNYPNLLRIFGGLADAAIAALKADPEWQKRFQTM